MSRYINETKAARSLESIVIMKGARHVATVQIHKTASRVLVNVRQSDEASERSAKATGKKPSDMVFQHAFARGYGYDKRTAALAGLVIDGHTLGDNCSREGVPNPPKGRKLYPADVKLPKGYFLANWADGSATYSDGTLRNPDVPATESGYRNCYRQPGLQYLLHIGYTVVQAI